MGGTTASSSMSKGKRRTAKDLRSGRGTGRPDRRRRLMKDGMDRLIEDLQDSHDGRDRHRRHVQRLAGRAGPGTENRTMSGGLVVAMLSVVVNRLGRGEAADSQNTEDQNDRKYGRNSTHDPKTPRSQSRWRMLAGSPPESQGSGRLRDPSLLLIGFDRRLRYTARIEVRGRSTSPALITLTTTKHRPC